MRTIRRARNPRQGLVKSPASHVTKLSSAFTNFSATLIMTSRKFPNSRASSHPARFPAGLENFPGFAQLDTRKGIEESSRRFSFELRVTLKSGKTERTPRAARQFLCIRMAKVQRRSWWLQRVRERRYVQVVEQCFTVLQTRYSNFQLGAYFCVLYAARGARFGRSARGNDRLDWQELPALFSNRWKVVKIL